MLVYSTHRAKPAISSSWKAFPLVLGLAAISIAIGCGSSGDGSGGSGGGASDTKFHPKTDGVPIAEAAACDMLVGAVNAKSTAIGTCTLTIPVCPGFVETVAGTQCAQFDQGSIKGCADYYSQAADCGDLVKRQQNCAFAAIANSAPKGCP